MTTPSPMLQQYHELKKQHPGTLLFFRLGDFYELFYDDAITGARELEITLTARNKERGAPIPMCGVPHHSVSAHIAKLIRKGYRVALCEQTEEASKTKKLVRREVVRVITPGTAIDPQIVESRETVYLAATCGTGGTFAVALLDLSTGEFRVTQFCGETAWRQAQDEIESYAPREVVFPASLTMLVEEAFQDVRHQTTLAQASAERNAGQRHDDQSPPKIQADKSDVKTNQHAAPLARISPANSATQNIALTPLDDWLWEREACDALLCEQFGVRTLAAFGIGDKPEAIRAAGACLRYVRETQRQTVRHINDLVFDRAQQHLVLDRITIGNLELLGTQGGGADRRATLLGILDQTQTQMGARLLRSWLLRPSVKRGEIEARLGAVAELHASQMVRDQVRASLGDVSDLDRLIGRINMNTATPRDLPALRRSLEQLPKLRRHLANAKSSLLSILFESIDELSDVCGLIKMAISDDPPVNITDGGVIRDGYSIDLDEVRGINQDAKQIIARFETDERKRSGISTLRVRFNNVSGYFIEVTKNQSSRVPVGYERKQTLANAERYTTAVLREWEQKTLTAEARILEIETGLFAETLAQIAAETKRLQATARALSMIDALASFADVAARRRYVKPELHDADELRIKAGRHPIIEALSLTPFVPNDLLMNNSTDRLLLITGPNMGGKSTILKQTALIALMAQAGSFVPATEASLPVFDRIWTRVGANDDLAGGRSTFMVEMTETASILRGATARSLVLLDEIGRGTATFDGLSIAWAVAEFLHDSPEHAAKTLFATHYHELTELAEKFPGARNYQIRVAEREDEIVFLYRLEAGRASKSYGIEVARLAGLPREVLQRAREVLNKLELYELAVFSDEVEPVAHAVAANTSASDKDSTGRLQAATTRARARASAAQATLFDAVNLSLLDELRDVDVETLSHEEARELLARLRKRAL